MKARIPKGLNSGAGGSWQKLAAQAQKMQADITRVSEELDEKEYAATAGNGDVNVTVLGKMEIKSIEIKPEIVDKDDVEMLTDLIIVAANKALSAASAEREAAMEKLSGGISIPGMM